MNQCQGSTHTKFTPIMTEKSVKSDLKKLSNKEKVPIYQRFFKTSPGEYGEGDIFIGVTVGDQRQVAKKNKDISFGETKKLFKSPIHEHRLTALIILTYKFQTGSESQRKEIFDFYFKNTQYINNWDLIDLSAYKIVGNYLFKKNKKILLQLAKSPSLWERRISIISTYYFIKNNEFSQTLKIAKLLLLDEHDLIHKAVGWMLREVGKKDLKIEEQFLKETYKEMPRTMLRYAIEKFPEAKRKSYLLGKA